LEAVLQGAKRHAFTGMSGDFSGSAKDVLSLSLADNFQRALSINEVMQHRELISHNVYCSHRQSESCSLELVDFTLRSYGSPSIGMIGSQPAMAAQLSKFVFSRAADLDPDDRGHERSGIVIENPEQIDRMLASSDLIPATVCAVVNATVESLLETKKPVIFSGVTRAGIAKLAAMPDSAPCSH